MTNDITNHYFDFENLSWPKITNDYIKALLQDMINSTAEIENKSTKEDNK